jgi:hypothetical protein
VLTEAVIITRLPTINDQFCPSILYQFPIAQTANPGQQCSITISIKVSVNNSNTS